MSSFKQSVEFLDKMEIIHIGEQIRQGLHCSNLIKDRRYHFWSYKSCVVGKDIIDWLLKHKHCDTREGAIEGLKILQSYSVFHHVCDDHLIKDEILFYRFTKDDETYVNDKDLVLFYKAQELHNGLSARTGGIIRSYQQDGELFRNAFQGSDFVDYLLKEGEAYSREEAVLIGRRLLESDTIRHVTDDYHFRDDNKLLYQFTLDFTRRRYLADVFNYVTPPRDSAIELRKDLHYHRQDRRKEPIAQPFYTPTNSPTSATEDHETVKNNINTLSTSPDEEHSDDSGVETPDNSIESNNEIPTPRSVLIRHASVEELESPETPYIKQTIKVTSDAVGFGFVLRGNCPTYVQAVDPMGPAAMAGLKVRQYIHSVNGQYVLRDDHKSVGKLIMQSYSQTLTMLRWTILRPFKIISYTTQTVQEKTGDLWDNYLDNRLQNISYPVWVQRVKAARVKPFSMLPLLQKQPEAHPIFFPI